MTRFQYFAGMYRIYRASAHGVVFSFTKATREAMARIRF